MKKFLLFCLVAVMLVSSVSVVAFAAASDWQKGNGFYTWKSVNPDSDPWNKAGMVQGDKVPVVTSDAEGEYGVTVEHAGYFTTADNWGGVSSMKEFNLDGLEVTVYFDTVPGVTSATDCWIAMDVLENRGTFHTTSGKNPGFVNLIRFAYNKIEFYNANGWGNNGSDEGFTVKSGDTIVLKSKFDVEKGYFMFTFTHNGVDFEVPADKSSGIGDSVLTDGKGYVTVMANCFGSDADNGFKYTVNVKDGAPLSDEILRARETRKAHTEAIASIDAQFANIEMVYENNAENKFVLESKSQDVKDNLAALTENFDKAKALKDKVTTVLGNAELDTEAQAAELTAILEDIKAINIEGVAIDERINSTLEAEAEAGETGENGDVNEEDDSTPDAAPATAPALGTANSNEGGFPVVPVVIIVVVVIVAAVVVVVLLKKKK